MRIKNLLLLLIAFLSGYLLIGQTNYNYPHTSVLSKGTWYKIAVSGTGIYKLTYNDLVNMGVNVSNLNTSDIAIFGNGGGMLPENNNIPRYNDLMENAIYVADGGDGKFEASDYILFYGESPNQWIYNAANKSFQYKVHSYSTQTYYFLTVDQGIGTQKRIDLQEELLTDATDTVTTFNGYRVQKRELINIPQSGKTWMGEKFSSAVPSWSFSFGIPNIVQGSKLAISYALATQSKSARFILKMNDQQFRDITFGMEGVKPDQKYFYAIRFLSDTLIAGSSNLNLNISYTNLTEFGDGFLESITLNALQNLIFSGGQMNFRSIQSVGTNKRTLFKIHNTDDKSVVWDVTNPIAPVKMRTELTGGELSFISNTELLREFVVFNGNSTLSPTFVEKVSNQNLHGIAQMDYIIVTHPKFKSQADRLAKLHQTYNGLDVAVVITNEVYNEFSSGAQDPIAIRCFMKMFFDRAVAGEGKTPKYLLLFGSGTYDSKNIEKKPNRNLVVVYESETSTLGTEDHSKATDDIFGRLDNTGKLNIGIGRFPATNTEEADILVNKVEDYMFRKDISEQKMKGDWRNVICLIADDPDASNIPGATTDKRFIESSEYLASKILNSTAKTFRNICLEKMYADAYKQTSSAIGNSYPDANKAIHNRINNGCLMINYVGHGSYQYLGVERYIIETDIAGWTNKYTLPIFVANTCSFSRFDYTELSSASEKAILTPNGGFIASIAPTRDVNDNQVLNSIFFENALTLIDGKPATFGDIVKSTKNANAEGEPYVLIGDPALKISLPQNTINTTKINNVEISSEADTLKALSNVTIEGEIRDNDSNLLSSFNGDIYPIVYDKPEKIQTLGNEGTLTIVTFEQQKNILYKGRANVRNGKFSFSFIIPRDMSYRFDYGKISYYAKNTNGIDAAGNYRNVVFGGIDETVSIEETYPKIRLYLNDTNFKSGGITDENPNLLAILSDKFGINTVGSGIGHDITAVIDNNVNEEILLNDFYDLDSLGRIIVRYPLSKLKPGTHTLTLKAWNIFNYSSTASISFAVQDSKHLELGKLKNAPNPFKGVTYFSIEHNLPDGIKSAEIQIFNTSGQLVRVLNMPITQGSYVLGPLEWNATSASGHQLVAGIYLSRIIVTTNSGEVKTENQKLVLLP